MCTSPNRVFYWQRGPDIEYKFTYGEKVNHIEVDSRGKVHICEDEWISPNAVIVSDQYYTVGCQVCLECQMLKAKHKTSRMCGESIIQGTDNAHFVTLTYDDAFLPKGEEVVDAQGEYVQYNTLNRRDLVLFNKRLRKRLFGNEKGNLRYVCCGEYGDLRGRPHLHGIYWNLPLTDLKLDTELTETGEKQYCSEWLESLWPYGRVRVSEVSQKSMAYVARYVQKKQYGDAGKEYAAMGIIPPFVTQSKGIGRDYFIQNAQKLYDFGEKFDSVNGESVHITPDRYFRKMVQSGKIKVIAGNVEQELDIQNKKYAALRDQSIKKQLSATDKSYDEYQKAKDAALRSRTKSLRRKGDFNEKKKSK